MQNLLGLPFDASAHGFEIDSMIALIHWLMAILFVGWGAFFVYTLFRFRRKKHPKADHVGVRSHASKYVEAGVAVFEGVLLVGFAIPFWSTLVNDVPDESKSTVVHVIAEQFAWNMHYAGADGVFGKTSISLITAENPVGLDRSDPDAKDDITTINQLNLPIGKPVILYLTSKDVIHSFGIPVLRVKHDAIPGERYTMWFTPTKTNAEIRQSLAHNASLIGGMTAALGRLVSMKDYTTSDGTSIIKSGEVFTEENVPLLLQAGITDVSVSPDTPAEIACAQLCGLGHYRMRGFVTLQTPEEFQAWLEEEASYLE